MPRLRRRTDPVLFGFVGAVTLAGAVVLAYAAVSTSTMRAITGSPAELAVLTAIVILGELFPVRVTFNNEAQDITTSTTFAFAILLIFGLGPAVLAQAIASAGSDLRLRKSWWKGLFNVAQYALAWAAAAVVLRAVNTNGEAWDTAGVTPMQLVAALAAAATFFVVNVGIISIAVALAQHESFRRLLGSRLGFYGFTSVVLFSLAPIVVVIADTNLVLVPLLLAPLLAVFRGAQVSMEKEHQALHDPLTDLPNRTQFHEQLRLRLHSRATGSLAVMIVDLDHFKEVNDTLGHPVGDRLLQEIAWRLRSSLRDEDMVARLGGDEFAILASLQQGDELAGIVEGIRNDFEVPFVIDELTFQMEASVGIAIAPDHGSEVDILLRKADVAMYLAKDRRKGFEIYDPDHDRHDALKLSLLAELRDAIDERQLVLHYQPKLDVATARVVGAEALVRWQHPEHGLLSADQFIPLAEPTGLIASLTRAVLNEALEQCHEWRKDGLDLEIAVNVSVRSLYDDHIVHDVSQLLERWGVPPACLILEVTESTMMLDPDRQIGVLSQLCALGVRLAIDDFGTGYSSLAYLRRLPASELKIDKSFVIGMVDNPDDATIVTSTIQLAHSLGLTITAEGVESQQAWDTLNALGCDRAQGFHLSRPLPRTAFAVWLACHNEELARLDALETVRSHAPAIASHAPPTPSHTPEIAVATPR